MVEQNNVYQLKRLVAKMRGITQDEIDGSTIADVLAQVVDAYSSGGSGATVVSAKAYTNISGMQGGGSIQLSDGTEVNMDLVAPMKLTITSEAGSSANMTKLTVSPPLTDGNKYRIQPSGGIPVYNYDLTGYGEEWDGVSEYEITSNQNLVVYECSQDDKCRGYGTVRAVIPE